MRLRLEWFVETRADEEETRAQCTTYMIEQFGETPPFWDGMPTEDMVEKVMLDPLVNDALLEHESVDNWIIESCFIERSER